MTRQGSQETPCPFGSTLERYWNKRYDLFSKWDEGICVDREGLYTVKPEAIALGIAESLPGESVIDATCGVGGVSIALARTGRRVTALDWSRDRLEMASHNAGLYGVRDRIRFVCTDLFEFLSTASADSVFFDPDWGGPSYRTAPHLRLSDLRPDGEALIAAGLNAAPTIMMCLPANFAFPELEAVPETRSHDLRFWSQSGTVVCVTCLLRRD